MLFLIKIGQNEKDSYNLSTNILKHGDIVELIPRHIRQEGVNFQQDLAGQKGEKHFFILNVDMTAFTDRQVDDIKQSIETPYYEDTGLVDENDNVILKLKHKRLYYFDFSKLQTLTESTKTEINNARTDKEDDQDINMMEINRPDKYISWENFEKCCINKELNLSIYDEKLTINPQEQTWKLLNG